MHRTGFVFALLVLVPGMSAVSFAAAAASGRTFAERWTQADRDGSGTVSRAEAQGFAPLREAFDAIDTDRNGELTPGEVRAWRAARKHNRAARPSGFSGQFAAGDADRDGSISRAEADARLPRVAANFEAIDADRDGRISRGELRAWIEKRRAAKTARDGK